MKLNLILFFSALFNIVTIYAGTTSISQGEQFLEKSKRTISFTENKGQVRDQNWQPRQDILFSGNAGGLIYHLKADGLHYQLNKIESWKEEDFSGKRFGKQMMSNQVSSYRVDVNWIGSNKNAQIIKAQELAGYDNFYNVPEGVEPALFVKSYQSITYKNIYDGIDLHFYEGEHGGIEYDFIVQPGADYKQIQLEINGGELAVTPKNELVIKTPFGDIIEGSLRVFQNDEEITSNWVVSDNRIAFEMENYNPLLSMRIDPPVRLWGSYYGGTQIDICNSVAVDNDGSIYLAGNTSSTTNVATIGAHQTSYGGGVDNDAFLVKFNSSGIRQWGTYYGGNNDDIGNSCSIDGFGNVYMAGKTFSTTNIETIGSYSQLNGICAKTAFLVKIDSIGVRQWCTYFTSSTSSPYTVCANDDVGNIYLAGSTFLCNLSTPGSHQQTISGGNNDAYLAKFDSSCVLLWCTNYGGGNDDYAMDCKVGEDGNVYIAGTTTSTNNIGTVGSHKASLTGGAGSDAFLAKFNSFGVRQWGTYHGGVSVDQGFGCAIDTSGYVYLVGQTNSSSGLSSTGAHQTALGGNYDAFLAKFDSLGVRLWGTFYGGTNYDYAYSCSLDKFSNVYFSGRTGSNTNIATADGFSTTVKGSDNFLVRFSPSGNRQWGTYYGGNGFEDGGRCTTDNEGNVYLVGYTGSNSLITSPSSHQDVFSGGTYDGYLVKFDGCINSSSINVNACNSYTSPSGNYTWTSSGFYNDIITNSLGCDSIIEINLIIDSTDVVSSYYSYIDPLDSLNLIVVNTSTGNISSYLWDFGDGNTSILQYPQHTYATVGNYQICLTVSDSNCSKTYCDSAIVSKSGGIISVSVIAPVITSTENINLSDGILIYPNPTNDYVTLQLSQTDVKDYSITLMNVIGEVISVQQLTTSITKIDLPKISGIYFIKIDSERENKIFKVIKK